MNLTAQEEYGLRCLLRVAQHEGPGPLTIQEIAEAEGLSPEYTAKLMRILRQGELVASTRGAGGGYRLARPAGSTTLSEVISVLGGGIFPASFCESHSGQQRDCVHVGGCTVRSVWRTLSSVVEAVLREVTLADLCRQTDGAPLEAKLARLAVGSAQGPGEEGARPAEGH